MLTESSSTAESGAVLGTGSSGPYLTNSSSPGTHTGGQGHHLPHQSTHPIADTLQGSERLYLVRWHPALPPIRTVKEPEVQDPFKWTALHVTLHLNQLLDSQFPHDVAISELTLMGVFH